MSIETLSTDIKYIRESVDTLNVKVEKTNGRVIKLEKWRAFLAGGMAVVSAILIPILFMALQGVQISIR